MANTKNEFEPKYQWGIGYVIDDPNAFVGSWLSDDADADLFVEQMMREK